MKIIHRGSTAALVVAVACALFWSRYGRANAPPGYYSTTDDTVMDTKTGRTWQRVAPTNSMTLDDAMTYCDTLDLAGQTDWRVPSMKELQTIVDEKRTNPAMDPTAFPNAPNGNYWTYAKWVGAPSSDPRIVAFDHGNSYHAALPGDNYVRCVR
ncbi:MAG TPA: DUF1566 domain-containing protein [Polyangium sp.]|nr:DUF1566 domain-containing protein [Polyangium sp.]